MTPSPERPRLEKAQLRSVFDRGARPASEFGIGVEYERFGIAGETGEPLPFEGEVSVSAVLRTLADRHGWSLAPGSPLGELQREGARITLEPGGQMELSGQLCRDVGGVASDLGAYIRDVQTASEPLGIRWLACGTHPTARLEQIPWIPKKRYQLMSAYLPTRGRLAHQMMKGTCGTQVNLDFSDEADAMSKYRLATALSAIVAAMFANSPFTAGRPNGFLSERTAVWLETDPDRCGPLRLAFDPSAGFDDYVEYALDVPMIFLQREGTLRPLGGKTFRRFLEEGHEGLEATMEDWSLHLTTLFPDVRLKSYIEIRATDSNSPALVLAHAALWRGLIYGGVKVRNSALETVSSLDFEDQVQLRADVARIGMRAEVAGGPVLDIALRVLELAAEGLDTSGAGAERAFLEPVSELVVGGGVTPAEDLLARTRSAGPRGREVMIERMASLAPFL